MNETEEQKITAKRKTEHIDICLHQDVDGRDISTGFERYRFRHNALPEINFAEMTIHTSFLGKQMRTPFLVSSMTGGTETARVINRNLAQMAEEKGWAMGLGSIRAAVEHPELLPTFHIRDVAPSIPIIANLGAVQLNYGFGVEHCRKAVELVGADGLVLHLNSLQEVFQPEGNTNFKSLLLVIGQLCREADFPVGVKEVGWGISREVAEKLWGAGVHFIDVAGAGGTSWSQVEKYRSRDNMKRKAAETFADWGMPTADCIREIRERFPERTVIGSGGLRHGLDAAKAIALGADLAGFGKTLLGSAMESADHLREWFERIEFELKVAMFGIGVSSLSELKQHSALERM